ncbi:MAG: SDR family NAD(P)-dependent oxidoreductase [Flavobacteriales bacterium]
MKPLERLNRTILITGATSGIGEATALRLAEEGNNIIITGRRKDRLDYLSEKIISIGAQALSLHFDVRDKDAVFSTLQTIPEEWSGIDVLINNAGLAAGLAPINSGMIADWERMIDTNLKGLLYVSRFISEKMVERGQGHIINVGSIAGKEVYPNGNVYVATKHAVDSLTRAMRMDLYDKGIKVSSVSPGMVETEFSIVRFHGDTNKAAQVYQGLKPLTALDVADAIAYILNTPSHVNVADILLLPAAQGSSRDVTRRH